MAADPRTRILDAAENAFAEHGLAGARVALIAADAGVNKAMLYYYYGAKEDLYRAVLRRVADHVGRLADRALVDPAAPPDARVAAFISAYRDFILSRPRLPRILMREILDGPERLIEVFAPRMGPSVATLQRTIAQGQAQGAIDPRIDPALTLIMIVAPVVLFTAAGPVVQAVIGRDPAGALEAFATTHSTTLLNGLRARREPA